MHTHLPISRPNATKVHKKTAQGPCDWVGKYYQYKIRVYCPWTQCMETSYATDPYSRSLAANSARSHIVDMRDAVLAPPGWAEHTAPRLDAWTDISVYELHVRDFRCAVGGRAMLLFCWECFA